MNQMTKAPSPAEVMENVLIRGDLSQLTAEEKGKYYTAICTSVGLNPLTKPFEYIVLNGKLRLYALKDCTDQLRSIHGISVTEMMESERDGVFIVKTKVANAQGRTDMSTGAVNINGLKGEVLANALMKAECVPMGSEILTRDGFKTYDHVVIGEEVLAYDCGSDTSVWTPLLNVTKYESAPLVRLKSTKGQFSVECTPDHSWAVRGYAYKSQANGTRAVRGPYKDRLPERRLVKARDINKSLSITLAAPESEEGVSLLTPVEAAILGWSVTDGTIKRVGNYVSIGICQSKEENFEAIRELAGGIARENVSKPRTRTFPSSGRTYDTLAQHWWNFPVGFSRPLLEKAGFRSRADLPRIVTRLDSHARAAMLQAFMLAEGDKRHVFANGDANIMEAFEILCALQGTASGSLKVKDTIWTKRLKLTRHVAGSFLNMEEIEPADVWCPTTAFGTWVMRQNGRVMITGNTKAKRRATLSICGLGLLDETEVDDMPASQKGPVERQRVPSPSDVPSKPLAAPAPSPDPVIDHIDETKPHKIVGGTFASWTDAYIAAVQSAGEPAVVMAWVDVNQPQLDKLAKGSPTDFTKVGTATAKHLEFLRKTAPTTVAGPQGEVSSDMGGETTYGPPKTTSKSRKGKEPAFEKDYDGWLKFQLEAIAKAEDPDKLEVIFTELDGRWTDLMPPDRELLMGARREAESRLEQ